MCGIFASISPGTVAPSPSSEHEAALRNRGPDLYNTVDITLDGPRHSTVTVKLVSTVLALRGDHVAHQPLMDSRTGSALCWNGEAWKIYSDKVEGNDGEYLSSLLKEDVRGNAITSQGNTFYSLRHIYGPYAFVYLDKVHGLIYFGRDCLGRRSLLYSVDESTGALLLSSVSGSSGTWKEVEADGIYMLALDKSTTRSMFEVLYPSEIQTPAFPIGKFPFMPSDRKGIMMSLNLNGINFATPEDVPVLDRSSPSVAALESQLKQSLDVRVRSIPEPPHEGRPEVKLAVLFSGGLDSTVLARMVHDILPLNEPIDLLNVAFENPRVVLASQQAPKVSKKPKKKAQRESQAEGSPAFDSIAEGGEPTSSEQAEPTSPYEACPDRITGRNAFAELQEVCPGRQWRFVAVNVPYTEFLEHKPKVIRLIRPHNTEMDLSITAALYFASRGTGIAITSSESLADSDDTPYTTSARVLLSGLGADELFGGYSRHGAAFSRGGFKDLIDELELDVSRLGKRNLGRDDRVISAWGREARFPFLDEDLVRWALNAPVWEKCGFGTREEAGEKGETAHLDPEKKVLRLLAWKLGLKRVAGEKKRAIQFGARTAKMETGRSKGTTLLS